MKSVFLVGISDAEANHIISIHETYEGALKVWNKERKRLINQLKRMKSYAVSHGECHDYDNYWNKDIKSLMCEDPDKIDSYPQETPYISKHDLLP